MVLDNFGDRKLKVNILFAVPIQKGNFCFPTSLDSLLNNIFKEANVSRSLKEMSWWKVLVKAGSGIGKSLLLKPLVLSYSILSY